MGSATRRSQWRLSRKQNHNHDTSKVRRWGLITVGPLQSPYQLMESCNFCKRLNRATPEAGNNDMNKAVCHGEARHDLRKLLLWFVVEVVSVSTPNTQVVDWG